MTTWCPSLYSRREAIPGWSGVGFSLECQTSYRPNTAVCLRYSYASTELWVLVLLRWPWKCPLDCKQYEGRFYVILVIIESSTMPGCGRSLYTFVGRVGIILYCYVLGFFTCFRIEAAVLDRKQGRIVFPFCSWQTSLYISKLSSVALSVKTSYLFWVQFA